MATPERRTDQLPALPQSSPGSPVPVAAPLGWALSVAAGIGLILASWLLYGTSADGMWAGYRDGIIGTVVLLAAMALNTTLPKRPAIGLLGLCGALLVLFAVFINEGQAVFITELAGGVVLLVGTALLAAGRR